ncbi:MAG: hypothetical protein M1820_001656 [Bogoriella megaspora]|nr:MAG: hypothetical protein M1820_001656 [Bogoriella megaspora]
MRLLSLYATLLTVGVASAIPSGEHDKDDDCACPVNGTLLPDALSPKYNIPISKKLPDIPFGNGSTATVTPNDFCTVFILEIPPSAFNKTCTLEFLFPNSSQTDADYVYNGPGNFVFNGYAYNATADSSTTYNTQPEAGPSPPPGNLQPGNSYVLNSGSCGIVPGQTAPSIVGGALCSNDTTLIYEQSKNKGCPLGFYIVIS